MGHDHDHIHAHALPRWRAIVGYGVASLLAIATFWLEMWGQHAAHSTGLLADAFHVASDGWFYVVAAWAAFKSTENTKQSQVAKMGLMVAGGITISLGLYRLSDPALKAPTMFFVALIGLLLNIAMVVVLAKIGGSHGHSHSHQAAMSHTVADLASSVVVCLVAALAYFLPGVSSPEYVGPIGAIGIGAMLMWQGKQRDKPHH